MAFSPLGNLFHLAAIDIRNKNKKLRFFVGGKKCKFNA